MAGCATGDVAMLVTIVGGEKIRVPFGRGGVVLSAEDDVQINTANFTLTKDKKFDYTFEFTDSRKRALRRVLVEDVSDNAPVLFVDDAQPQLSAAGQWRGRLELPDLAEPRMGWVATISNSVRVFRFTLTFADGKTLVIHQGEFYPPAEKAAIRHLFGQNY